jgi:ATP-dependent Clp protease adaptor protein ClpS
VAEQTPRTTGDVLEKPTTVLKEPDHWRVLLLNDDYTPMDFVVEILETVFHKPPAEAYRLMMQVHTQGNAVAGTYTHEVAETRAATVVELAQGAGYPLQAMVEQA